MKFVISPAKTLDLDSIVPSLAYTQPRFLSEAQTLIASLQNYTPAQIASMMKLSDTLATLNVERYQQWQHQHTDQNSRPALFTFMGDVYTGLDAYSLTAEDVLYAQQHLRILSGLYGLLLPLDLIQAYRLEMGTKLTTPHGTNLYSFWQSHLTAQLQQHLDVDEPLINLASTEYFKAIVRSDLQRPIISPIFLDEKNGQFKVISFYAKKARGMMARYLIQQRCETLEDMCRFDCAGYRYEASRSSVSEPVFIRYEIDQPR